MKRYFWCIFIYAILSCNPTVARPTWQPAFDVSVEDTKTWTSAPLTLTTWSPVISAGLPSCAGLLPIDCKRRHVRYYLTQLLTKQEKKKSLIDTILG